MSTQSRIEVYGTDGEELIQVSAKEMENRDGRTNLIEVNLCGVEISRGVIERCDFTLGEFDESRITDVVVDNSEFEGTMFEDALLRNLSFSNSLMYAITTYGAKFVSCSFENTQFLGCDLSITDFVDCRFNGVYFGSDNTGFHTQLNETDFSTSRFENVEFGGAKFNRRTMFPPSLKPGTNRWSVRGRRLIRRGQVVLFIA